MPRLLAAQVRAAPLHLLVHVPVADLRFHDVDPRGAQRLVEAEIGHDGGDDAVAFETVAARHVARRDGERVVAVANLPEIVDRDQAVTVTVEGEAELRTRGLHLLLKRLREERADAGVDVDAVGLRPERDHPGAQAPEDARRHPMRGSVGAVDGNRQSRQVEREAATEVLHVVDVEPADVLAVRARRRVIAGQPPLDLVFPGVGELGALRGEELDAVVFVGIVRRGKHDAALRFERAREERDARGRQHADRVALPARGQHARHHRGLEQLPGDPRVATDDDSNALRPVLAERRDELAPHPERELGGERLDVRHTANSVRSEQPAHRPAAFSRASCGPDCGCDIEPSAISTVTWTVRSRVK